MATGKKAKKKSPIKVKALGNVDGQYQFRFGGFARAGGGRPFRLIGVGYMALSNGKDVSGRQWSTIMPMQGVNDSFDHQTDGWDLTGSYAIESATNTLK